MATSRPDPAEDVETLARTVYGEARGESYQGQLAVAYVVRNRADLRTWFGSTVREVCLKPHQFSCWLPEDPNYDRIISATLADQAFRTCFRAAISAYDRSESDPTSGATHYHTIDAPGFATTWPPRWTDQMVHTTSIGAHTFYREAV